MTDEHSVTRGGYEEPPDNFKVKDGKDNTIFCFRCQGSTLPARQGDSVPGIGKGGREMIQCDHCNLSWHLECLDPPLAVPPKKIVRNGKTKATWMCPNHTDPLLNDIDPTTNPENTDRPTTSRRYKIREPKNAVTVNSTMTRGVKNNGIIEVIDDPSGDELSTPDTPFQIPRLSERGIKLDFIDRIKQ